jgi:hypothetical protein
VADEQLAELLPAETASFASPVPMRVVSGDEWHHAWARRDRFADLKAGYLRSGPGRSNLRDGWVRNSG